MPLLVQCGAARARSASCGRRACATDRRRSRRCRSSPVLRRALLRSACRSRARSARPSSFLLRRSASPSSRTSSPRWGAGTSAQRRAASTARVMIWFELRRGWLRARTEAPAVDRAETVDRPLGRLALQRQIEVSLQLLDFSMTHDAFSNGCGRGRDSAVAAQLGSAR